MNDSELEQRLSAYAQGIGPTPQARARLRRKLAAGPAQRRTPMALGVLALCGLAIAIAAAIAIGLPTGPRPIEPSSQWERLTPEIAVFSTGHGVWDNGILRWEDGALRLSVEPDRGVHLRILTPEAVVEVVGTVFAVERGEEGTSVMVSRGRVSVACRDEQETLLDPGDARTCFRGPEAGLGHAMRLEREGVGAEGWLPEVARALALPGGDPDARKALLAMQVDGLLAGGRLDDAALAARGLLTDGEDLSPISAVAAALLADRGCDPARPFLAHLSASGDGIAAVRLADCTPDPSDRRRILNVGRSDPRPEVRAAIEARLLELESP